ncbi:MAG TPA: hypothetical protein EYH04_04080 [Archaeoglobus profundus]|nr:hypothetical protein [Archaeoglobus profundus]
MHGQPLGRETYNIAFVLDTFQSDDTLYLKDLNLLLNRFRARPFQKPAADYNEGHGVCDELRYNYKSSREPELSSDLFPPTSLVGGTQDYK